MGLNDWILALHLVSAVALIAAMTMFSVMIAALWRTDDPAAVTSFMRVGLVGNVLVTIGTLGTIVFGVWLAISLDALRSPFTRCPFASMMTMSSGLTNFLLQIVGVHMM